MSPVLKVGFFVFVAALYSCSVDSEKPSFQDWSGEIKAGPYNPSQIKTAQLISKPFKIDTVYRSMKGPVDEEEFYLADSGEVIWFTGYKVEVINETGEVLEDGFMCHNNLNLDSKRHFPWQPQTFFCY